MAGEEARWPLPDRPDAIETIAGPRWQLDISPQLDGALIRASARHRGDWLCVTRPVDDEALAGRDIRRLGGFVLAPFCNRIAGAAFSHEGRLYRLPPNWPADPGTAIHGLSWQRPWTVAARAAGRLTLAQEIAEAHYPFRYQAVLEVDVDGPAARLALSLTNTGGEALPFGVGFHPYLRRTPEARIAFAADGWLEPDSRCYPRQWHALPPGLEAAAGRPVETFAGIDASFTGWSRAATLTWPELGAALTLEASLSARLLHLYVPAGQPFLCIEPVSHVIDVVNRRELARFGDMTVLAPGERLAISMAWRLGEAAPG